MEEDAKKPRDAGIHALRQSLDLAKDGQPNEALQILDDAIAQAIEEECGIWVGILCRHAAVLARPKGDISRERRYSEQVLPYADAHQFACYIKPGVRQQKRPLARPLLG